MRSAIVLGILVAMTGGCAGPKAHVSELAAPTQVDDERSPVSELSAASQVVDEGPQTAFDITKHVYVSGAVFRPGRYDRTNGMTVLNAIQMAGGCKESPERVRVTHTDRITESYRYLRIIDESLEPPLLRAGDRVMVSRRIL